MSCRIFFSIPVRSYSNEGTVGVLEVEDSRPIVRFVLLKSASCTGRYPRKIVIGIHRDIEPENGHVASLIEILVEDEKMTHAFYSNKSTI